MIVYKYLAPARIDVLEHSRIRFTQPSALNDPFETFPCYTEYGPWLLDRIHHRAVHKFGPEAAEQTFRERRALVVKTLLNLPDTLSKHFVILSLSQICDNPLMWSHYAESHRGFVIGFDSSSSFFAPGNGKGKDGLVKVHYSEDRYVIPKSGFNSLDDQNLHDWNAKVFFTKGPHWRYEKEMRILAHPKAADFTLPGADGHDICLFKFPPESLKELVFGYRMIDSDRKRAFNLLKTKYPWAKISITVPDQSKFSFSISTFAG